MAARMVRMLLLRISSVYLFDEIVQGYYIGILAYIDVVVECGLEFPHFHGHPKPPV